MVLFDFSTCLAHFSKENKKCFAENNAITESVSCVLQLYLETGILEVVLQTQNLRFRER